MDRRASVGAGKSPPAPAVWQHPFVDIFKTFDLGSAERRGDVSEDLDRQICKPVLRIRGPVSANNYIRLPATKSNTKTLGLTGEYIYVQLKALEMKFFLVHLDFTVAVVNALRITLSNMYTDVKATHHSVQCPCHLPNDGWAVVCLSVPSILATYTKLPKHAFSLKKVQFCSSLFIKNIYTSDIRYTPDTLPREMLLDHRPFAACHTWIDLPGAAEVSDSSGIGDGRGEGPGQKESMSSLKTLPEVGLAAEEPAAESGSQEPSSGTLGTSQDPMFQNYEYRPPLIPDPMLEVSHLIGVSRKTRKITGLSELIPRRFAVFIRSGGDQVVESLDFKNGPSSDVSCSVLHASSMTLVAVDPQRPAQRSYFGHSRPIELLEASDDGLWVASVQSAASGAPPLMRLWRVEACGGLRCLSVLSCPSLSGVRAASFDPSAKYLALAGTDLQGRQQLMVWDMSRLLCGGNISLTAKQTSADWDIDYIRFSPFEEMSIVTCGKESIRFWRAKDGHLPGCSVVLNSLARQFHFTCIAFEFNKMSQPYFLGEHLGDRQRMFVGTNKGKLLQLSYKDRKVQVVFQLHSAAITSICANEGFVVTASMDKYVRVWPLDFNSYYLHAMHDSPVVGVDITVDGLQVLCSTADGSVGILDMQTHNYADLVHTHGAMISDAAVSLFYQELVTASRDGTLKVWSLNSMTQTHEFTVADDVPLVVAFHPAGRHLIAGGFRSGCMRVFDVDGPAVLCEYRHHVQPIVSLAFVKESSGNTATGTAQIVTCDSTGALVFHDEAYNFEVVRCPERTLCTSPPENCPAMVCVPPWLLQYFDPHCVGLLSYPRLDLECKLRAPTSTVCTFALSFYAHFAVLGTADSRMHFFDVKTGDHMITYTFSSGQFSAVSLTSFDIGSPFQGLALMIVAAADAQLRLVNISEDEVMSKNGREPPDLRASVNASRSSAVAPLVAHDHVNEQCFIGHATPPHSVLITPRCLVSVSSSEVICWATSGNYFEQLFLEDVLRDRQIPRPVRQRGRIQKSLVPQRFTEGPEAAPQLRKSLLNAQSPEGPGSSPQTEKSLASPPLAEVPEVAPSGHTSLEYSQTLGQPNAAASTLAVQLTKPEFDAAQATQQSVSEESPSPHRTEHHKRDVLYHDASELGLASLHDFEVEDGEAAALSAAENEEASVEAATDAVGAGSGAAMEGGWGSLADIIIKPCTENHHAKAFGLHLQGLTGCAVVGNSQPFAWQPDPGLLCHTVGCMVHVEKLSGGDAPEVSGSSDSAPAWLADMPGLSALALDLSPDGEGLLAVLSVDTAGEGGCMAWISLWGVEDLTRIALVELPDTYAVHVSPAGEDDCEAVTSASVASAIPAPLLRLTSGGEKAITTVPVGESGGRVDVWSLQGDDSCLICSADTHFAPIGLLLLSSIGEEFLTLSSGALVFWRCSGDATAGVDMHLQFQLAEAHDSHHHLPHFTAFCLVQLGSWQMLLAGTADGRLFTYNADENQHLSELPLASEAIGAIACASWPTLVCGIGDQLHRFTLGQSSEGFLEASDTSSALQLDGHIQELRMQKLGEEGIASTSANTLWYFHLQKGIKVALQSFHNAPSRVLRSNTAFLEGSAGATMHADQVMPEVVATCADDGCIRIWGVSHGRPCAQVVAQLQGSGTCTSLAFLNVDTLASAMLDGCVCVFNLSSMDLIAKIEVGAGDPLLALEALSSNSLVVGAASGRLVQLVLEQPSFEPAGAPVSAAEEIQLHRPGDRCAAVCGLATDREESPQRLLVCFTSLEVWLWECQNSSEQRPRHVRTWSWPESQPKPRPPGCCRTSSLCLDLLSSPPVVASFVETKEAGTLVVVCAPPVTCFYVYSCEQGVILNRISAGQKMTSVVRLWTPPLLILRQHEREVTGARHAAGAILLVLSGDSFARLRLLDGGTRAVWLEEPLQLPGCGTGLWPRRGTPAACWVAGGDADVAERGKKNRGRQQTLRILLKGESALSSWTMAW